MKKAEFDEIISFSHPNSAKYLAIAEKNRYNGLDHVSNREELAV